ncbi:hypothetical protein SAMN02927937_00922 [Paenimyroides aquimaris]|uniref:Lipoprotein n=1 Tax=Paenimyroides marinum TaxID=1159016 RepID=A0A1H6KEA5_9FLAO|nr:hypothetical protein [Paenimyroides aquimaris]SEH69832.1 hypothetical protein SAMN02927937_00922 [Paenimyroides aquimaris]
MKTKLFILIFGAIVFASCQQKEMKISRSDFSVQTEMTDFSPVYISKNDKGNVEINKNNLIGNTHWVISADRDLTLNEIAPFLQQLTEKKYKKGGLHPDTKDIYMVYSDTVHKQNAYVELPFKEIYIDVPPPEIESELNVRYLHKVLNVKDFKEKFFERTAIKEPYEKIDINFSKNMFVEEFVNILIEMEKQDIIKTIDISTSIY